MATRQQAANRDATPTGMARLGQSHTIQKQPAARPRGAICAEGLYVGDYGGHILLTLPPLIPAQAGIQLVISGYTNKTRRHAVPENLDPRLRGDARRVWELWVFFRPLCYVSEGWDQVGYLGLHQQDEEARRT